MRRFAAAVCTCAMLGVAHAAERNPLESKLIVDAGWFFMSTDTRVRVDGQTSDEIGTDVDYDDTFGLGDFDRFRGEVSWRIAPRHLIRGMYFQNNRTGTRVLNQDVEFSGETYPVGATVDARSDLKIAQLSYEYAFLRRESYEIAGGIGIHYMDMGLQLDATVISQGTTVSRSLAEEATTKAPLPVLGLRGLWVLPNNFYVSAQAQYFHLNFDPYTGSLLDLKASIVWQASDHVGFGIAYNDFGFKFDIDEQGANDFNGHLRWDYSGAVAFATFMF